MNGDELAAMLYPKPYDDPLFDMLVEPGDFPEVDMEAVRRGTEQACRNITDCNANFFKRSSKD